MSTGGEGPSEEKAADAEAAEAAERGPAYRRSDLLDAVSARSAMKKADLRTAVELVLDELGRALSDSRDLALPPLGRVKQVKRKDTGGAEVLTLRLRRPGPGKDEGSGKD
ncbi:DNA-binding protein [Rhodobacterales bacterium HKCCE2091]|nr:DNA-binding protein [Rhodobacterales bacterium HKCCE2091]